MGLKTRVDKLVWLRERTEDGALASLARARVDLDRAHEQVTLAAEATRRDTRSAGPVELWLIDDAGHRRALQRLRAAEASAEQAVKVEAAALDGYTSARQDAHSVRRVQERRRADLLLGLGRRERREFDEIATLRFNAGRS
jgi:hypothetical protein